MKGFKLLAIRPLKGCDKKYSKNLTNGKLYQLYNDYSFEFDKTNKIKAIKYTENVPSNFYNRKDINIQISAIVGKNGSGKSTLMELVYLLIYYYAVENKILETPKIGIEKCIKLAKNRVQELEEGKNKLLKKDSNINFSTLEETIKQYNKTERILNWNKDELNKFEILKSINLKIKENLKLEIYYQIEDTIYILKNDNELTFKEFKQNKKDKNKWQYSNKNSDSQLFYSLVLNYSQYALNSREIGVWITELFHKNDGYQTPIVINPMRTDGSYNINKENKLVKQRLLVNILTPLNKTKPENSLRNLTNNHIAQYLKIEFDKDKCDKKLLNKYLKEWQKIEKTFLNEKRIKTTIWDDDAKAYILGKLISMAEKYFSNKNYFSNDKFNNFNDYIKTLNTNSHIAYKFYQAINFLKYDYALLFDGIVNVDTISKEIEREIDLGKENLIKYIPPPFFKIDVLFDNEKETKNTLKHLSSGEKQYVFSISSIMYHLRYLDSVDENIVDGKYKKHTNINLIFDEIELYYHPEMQRNFINDLLNAIEQSNLISIKNINCTFITHSPFILSDIPRANILSLKDGEPRNDISEQTFGANIHELLTYNFFMKSTIGEFAQKNIKEIITFYQKVRFSENNSKASLKEEYFSLKEKFHFIKNNIGEETIKYVINNHIEFIEENLYDDKN